MSNDRSAKSQAIGNLLPKITGKIFTKQSHILVHLIHNWGQVIGPEYAKFSVPARLNFMKGESTKGTLQVLIDGSHALEFQYLCGVMMEKINQSLGFEAIGRITLQQVPFPRRQKPKSSQKARPEFAGKSPALAQEIDKIQDEKVRDALKNLLTTIIAESQT